MMIRSLFVLILFIPTVTFADSTIVLNPIEVRGDRLFVFRDTIPTTTTIFTAEQLETMPVQSIGDVLTSVAGVHVRRYGGVGSELISIRGSAADHVLILVDGQKINSSRSGVGDVSLIPLSKIAEIQVERSSAVAKWGSDAIGGAINLITKKSQENQSDITLKAGTYTNYQLNMSHQQQWTGGHLQLGLGIRDGNTDFTYQTQDNVYRITNNDFSTKNGDLKLHFDLFTPAEGDVTLNLSAFQAKRGSAGTITFPTPQAKTTEEYLSSQLLSKWKYLFPLASETTFQSTISQRLSQYQKNPTAPQYKHRNRRWQNKGGILFRFSPSISAHVGGESQLDKLESTTDGSPHRTTFAGVIQGEFQWQQFTITPAIRGDFSKSFPAQWSPQMGIHLELISNRLMVRGSIARTVKLPDFDDLFWTQTGLAQGNPNLRPERGLNMDAGLVIYPHPKFRIEGNIFSNRIDDWIQWSNTGGGIWQPSNIAQAEIRGVEVQGNWQLSISKRAVLYLMGNYTYLDPRNRSGNHATDGKILIGRSQHLANGSLQFFLNRWSLTVEGHHVDRRPLNAANFHWLDDYQLWDFKIEGRFNDVFKAGLSCLNIGDQHYADFQYMPMPGREWVAEINFTF